MNSGITFLADAPKLVEPVASGLQLILAFLAGIAVIVVLITVVKLHPFLALIFGALTVGLVAGENLTKVLKSFSDGFGSTAASVGILIALGAMFAKLLADSGGADEIVDTIVGHASPRMLPWAMALVGAIIGLPMFFEIGLVLLMPVIYLVVAPVAAVADHRRNPGAGRPFRDARLRAAAPGAADRDRATQRRPRPHPRARRGRWPIPTIILAGPLFGKLAGRWVVVDAPDTFDADRFADGAERRRPSFGITLFSVLLPVVADAGQGARRHLHRRRKQWFRQIFDTLGTPLIALLIAVIVGMFTLGRGAGMSRDEITKCIESGSAAGGGHHPDRRGGRRLQAGAGGHRHRHAARGLGQGRATSR